MEQNRQQNKLLPCAEQGRTEQNRVGPGWAGLDCAETGQERAGQCKGQRRTQRTAGQDEGRDDLWGRAEGRVDWTTGQRRGYGTPVGEAWCSAGQAGPCGTGEEQSNEERGGGHSRLHDTGIGGRAKSSRAKDDGG